MQASSVARGSSRRALAGGVARAAPAAAARPAPAPAAVRRAARARAPGRGAAMAVRAAAAEPAVAERLSEARAEELLNGVGAFIFDCDGVIWRGDSVLPGVPETLDALRALGKKLVFVTNNSTKSREGYLGKFKSLGLNVNAEEIYSSSFAAAAYLQSKSFPTDGSKKVYVVGEVGICDELDLAGIQYLGGPADSDKKITLSKGLRLDQDPSVAAVIVGFDRDVNYHKIQMATLCIRENEDCEFIATNTDAVTHLTDAQEWAGNGSMVGAIKGSTKVEPTVVGKPSSFMLDDIAAKFGLKKDEICMVGDRLDTDILFGKNGGLSTMLVLTGVTSEETLMSPENDIQPDVYTTGLKDLLPAAQKLA